jgi:hypothetical protein
MKINANQIKTNIYLDSFNIDKRIIPLFRTPIILKKIDQLKKSKDNNSTVIQKNLTFKIIPLNKKLVKYSNIIDNFKKSINKLILINIKEKNIYNSKFIFLDNNDLSKLKIYLNKILWPLHSSSFDESVYSKPFTSVKWERNITGSVLTAFSPALSLLRNQKDKENNFKKIIELRSLLVILNKMQNHIKLLISLRKKLILKKKIKIIKSVLVEEAIKLKKEDLQKKIEIFNITKEKNKYISFPANDSFYQKEILIFKEDIESMLANSFDLFVLISNDLSFDQIMEGNETKINLVHQPDDSSYNNINNNNNIRNIISLVQQSNIENSLDHQKNKSDNSAQNNKFSTLGIKQAIEENKKKMVVTLKSMIYKHKKFDPEISIVENRTPVNLIYYSKNNNTSISQYLKSMSIFNMINKGTFIYFSSSIGYFFKLKNYIKYKNIYKLLFYFFKTMFCLISKPVFIHKSDKIIIQLYYFLILPNFFKDKLLRRNFRFKKLMKKFKKGEIKRRPYKYIANFKTKKRIWKFNKFKLKLKILLKKTSNVSLVNLYPKKFRIICNVLSKAFNKNIELNLIRLHYPYKNSNILANLLALLVNKIKLRRITRKLFKYAVIKNLKNIVFDNKANYIPAYLTGMTIKIGGRLMKYKVIPRKTTQKVQKGSSSFGKVNFTDFARYTSKNRRGAFSITVSSGHNFF